MTPHFIARQLSCPRGILGRIIANLMNRHNASMNAFAVQQLAVKPSDRVLEIGFGGGVAIPALIEGAAFVTGVDRSEDMVRRANARFYEARAAGRADFRLGSVERLPCQSESFHKVCTVNTVYFWPSLEAGFAEIYRVLLPGGKLAVGFLPKGPMSAMGNPPDVFTLIEPGVVIAALTAVGFLRARVERPRPETAWNVIVAMRGPVDLSSHSGISRALAGR